MVEGLLALSGKADSATLWRPIRIRADRGQGQLTIAEVQVVRDEERSESIALSEVETVTVRTRQPLASSMTEEPPYSVEHPRSVEAVVRHRGRTGPARESVVRLDVLGLDTCDKAADLAFRLGAAMGLSHYRVVRSDPRRIEIELAGRAGDGFEPLPPLPRQTSYASGGVPPAASRVAAAYRTPEPDPSGFPGARDGRVIHWAPGREIQVDTPRGAAVLGCLPFAVAGLAAGPLFWLLFRDGSAAVVVGIVGLALGGVALAMAAKSLPRRVRIGWSEREMVVSDPFSRRRIPLDRVSAVDVRCVRRSYKTGSQHSRKVHHRLYSCAVDARARGDAGTTSVGILVTREFEDDPERPYDAALPLARELAETLGVEWRVVDYD
jgi:hypothetical protein